LWSYWCCCSWCMRWWIVQYPFESLFRSLQYALLDNSCREYLFTCDFFIVSASTALDFFNSIFGKTVAMFMVCFSSSQAGRLERCADVHKYPGVDWALMSCTTAETAVHPEINLIQISLDLWHILGGILHLIRIAEFGQFNNGLQSLFATRNVLWFSAQKSWLMEHNWASLQQSRRLLADFHWFFHCWYCIVVCVA